eukprot:3068574-Amphidinium_carterae.8
MDSTCPCCMPSRSCGSTVGLLASEVLRRLVVKLFCQEVEVVLNSCVVALSPTTRRSSTYAMMLVLNCSYYCLGDVLCPWSAFVMVQGVCGVLIAIASISRIAIEDGVVANVCVSVP